MKRKRLIWQIVPLYLLITVVALLAVSWYSFSIFKKFHQNQVSKNIAVSAKLTAEQFRNLLLNQESAQIDSLSKVLGQKTLLRISIILPDGKVVGDSEEDPLKMDNHTNRVEISQALTMDEGTSIRYSTTLGQEMLYEAIPIRHKDNLIGICRVSIPLTSIEKAFGNIYTKIILAGIIITLLAIFAGLWISDQINQPLEEIKKGAQKFAKGDFSNKLSVPKTEEIGTLAETMNEMASELQYLESVRKDFVANVSHELRTPITSIKGFAETLSEGAIHNKEEALKFLAIIQKQSDRMDAIIQDLLSLATIEQSGEKSEIQYDTIRLDSVLQNVIEVCEKLATDKNIHLNRDCPEGLEARINAPLLEQAIINLVDNAVKYSPADSTVTIRVCKNEKNVLQIDVIDKGAGIDKQHIPRLFERFYRIDKARSRSLGGTGLGLAIVKHIAQIHHGRVHVFSEPGKGSTFSIILP